MQPALWRTSGLRVEVDGNCFRQTFFGCSREHTEVEVFSEMVKRHQMHFWSTKIDEILTKPRIAFRADMKTYPV